MYNNFISQGNHFPQLDKNNYVEDAFWFFMRFLRLIASTSFVLGLLKV